MRILFVVPYVPSLVRTRSYNLIRHLSARRHSVIVATLWSTDREWAEVNDLKKECDQVHAVRLPVWRSLVNCVRAIPSAEPLQSVYCWTPDLLSKIISLQVDTDVVHVEHLRGAKYGLHLKSRHARSAVPVVWDSVDCISYLFEQAMVGRHDRVGRLVNRLELSRTRRHEGWLWPQFDRVLITSEIDRDALINLASTTSDSRDQFVEVLPNGVDTNYFAASYEPRCSRTLVFSGKMSYHANVTAAVHLVTEIMPFIWARMPDVHLEIVGKDPPNLLRKLAASHGPLVTVTGTVPDIRPFLAKASVAVIPLVYGAGSQFKVLEAMSCAIPVVATPRAVASLDVRPGRDVVVAEEPRAFAEAVLALLDDPQRQREIGKAGRAYVETHHRWDRIAERLEAVYQELLAERRGSFRRRA